MDYNLKLNNETSQLKIETKAENEMLVEIDDKKIDVAYSFLSEHHLHLDVVQGEDTSGINVYVAGDAEEKIMMINGTLYTIEDTDLTAKKSSRKKRETSLPDEITPPMPSAVVSIPVSIDDIVDKGDSVIILSAMKMETTLVAPYNGKVTGINVTEGDKVMPGDILVEIKKSEEV